MTAPRKPGRPIRGASRLVSRAYRLDEATIAAIKRLGEELGISHAQVVARAVEWMAAGGAKALYEEVARQVMRARVQALEDALAAEVARQAEGQS